VRLPSIRTDTREALPDFIAVFAAEGQRLGCQGSNLDMTPV
jgi:hypothetical protein